MIIAALLAILPAYHPDVPVTGTLRITTGSYGRVLVANWGEGFRRFHPQAAVVGDLGKAGSGGIPESLYDDRHADLGLLGRELTPAECLEFWRNTGADPFLVTTATGSYAAIDKTMPMIVIVNRENPIPGLTVSQLDGIYGEWRDGGYDGQYWRTDRARGPEADIRTWGQAGLGGDWRAHAIDVYGYDVQRDNFALFFAQRVMHGGDKWTPALHEFGFSIAHGEMGLNGAPHKAGSAPMVEAVARDRYAIGYCTVRDATPAVKVVALAWTDGGPFLLPTRENVLARTYPLTRSIYWVVRTGPKGLDPRVREFLRYVLSREGQADVEREGAYLPLTDAAAAEERAKLR